MKKTLPGLNGLRAIAALMVLVTHVYQIAGIFGDEFSKQLYNQHHLVGTTMVNLFFVISGFIITYVLYNEKARTGTISLKNFYIKRFLRIWPIYFLILILVIILVKFTNLYALFPTINGLGIVLIVFFIITISPIAPAALISVLPHYWSLSVEEQFYIFWPIIFKKIKPRQVLTVCLLIIAGIAFLRNTFAYLESSYHKPLYTGFRVIFNDSMFGSIAIGIIGAWLLEHKHRFLKHIYNKGLQLLCWGIFLLSIIYPFYVPYFHFEIMAAVCLVLVLNVTSNPQTIVSLNFPLLDKAGVISYGIYLFHWPLIPILIIGIKKIGLWDAFVAAKQLPLVAVSMVLTYLLASFSYKYFESFFLRMKPTS
jgi:peptidoglycan/LPS O-acetylase OafA/YrhL